MDMGRKLGNCFLPIGSKILDLLPKDEDEDMLQLLTVMMCIWLAESRRFKPFLHLSGEDKERWRGFAWTQSQGFEPWLNPKQKAVECSSSNRNCSELLHFGSDLYRDLRSSLLWWTHQLSWNRRIGCFFQLVSVPNSEKGELERWDTVCVSMFVFRRWYPGNLHVCISQILHGEDHPISWGSIADVKRSMRSSSLPMSWNCLWKGASTWYMIYWNMVLKNMLVVIALYGGWQRVSS